MSQTSFDKDKIKILLLEGVHASALERFHAAGYENIERKAGALQGDELAHALADVHILGIRSRTQLTASALAEARRLITVGCFCIGTNQVALKDAMLRGVPVFNAPFSNTRSVAELVLAEAVLLLRGIPEKTRPAATGRVAEERNREFRDPRQNARRDRLRQHRLAARRDGRSARHARAVLRRGETS